MKEFQEKLRRELNLERDPFFVVLFSTFVIKTYTDWDKGLEDLKLTCDGYIEDLRKNIKSEEIGKYIKECDEKNKDLSVTLNQGIDVNLQFIPAKREAEDKQNNRIVRK